MFFQILLVVCLWFLLGLVGHGVFFGKISSLDYLRIFGEDREQNPKRILRRILLSALRGPFAHAALRHKL